MEKHKVVIIGAGPGGLRCAKILAEKGLEVVLLEKEKEIKRKICAGLWFINRRASDLNLPDDIFQKKFDRIFFKTRREEFYFRYSKPFITTLSREKLNEWLLKQAINKGAQVRFNSSVTEVNKDYVIANGQKIYFDYLIGADGSNSIVRRFLKLKTEIVAVALQYWVPGDYKELEIHFDSKRFGSWYAWKAPHNGLMSVGSGGFPQKMTKDINLKDNLINWCKENNLEIQGLNLEGAILNADYRGFKFNNIYLVGDAAGLVSELTGEGIYFAIASGEDVAKMIINNKHKPILINNILKIRRKHKIILKMFYLNKYFNEAIYSLSFNLLKIKFFKNLFIELI